MLKAVTKIIWLVVFVLILAVSACTSLPDSPPVASGAAEPEAEYVIGPGDTLNIFVWRVPEVSSEVPVRPDGKISMPLVENMQAAGKTPSQLARDLEKKLYAYLKKPVVTVTVTGFVGNLGENIRVVGEAVEPKTLMYRDDLTLLDVMIEVGGLTEFAAGNRAKIVRRVNGKQVEFKVRLRDLIKKGDMSANLHMYPGDILIIPESWF
jgi:polysaccharide export outer membrane protein